MDVQEKSHMDCRSLQCTADFHDPGHVSHKQTPATNAFSC